MTKRLLVLILVMMCVLMGACSNNASEDRDYAADNSDSDTEEFAQEDSNNNMDESSEGESVSNDQLENNSGEENAASQADEKVQSDRKIIYKANLRIEVKDYQNTVNAIEDEVSERGGYITESNMHEGPEDGSTSGQITVRIPQDHFRDFIQAVEDGSSNVLESSVSGQDVTEEYIDLESRLKSKRVVEERLQSFMKEAKKTEDLLKISEDLGKVQQEIEEITGRMNYLENKIDLATVTIHLQENKVSLTSEKDLNTWDKTKQQFLKSINFILTAFSGFIVFIAGSSPVLVILGIIGLIVYWIIRSRKNKGSEN